MLHTLMTAERRSIPVPGAPFGLSEKSLLTLRVCAMPSGLERTELYLAVCAAYSLKAIRHKLIELAERGYVVVVPGSHPSTARITDKGQAVLDAMARVSGV